MELLHSAPTVIFLYLQRTILLLFYFIFSNFSLSGAQTQKIKFVNYFEGREYDCIRYHDGVILGQRIGPISSLAFHP